MAGHTPTGFDRQRLRLLPLGSRVHDMDLSVLLPLLRPASPAPEQLRRTAGRIKEARAEGRQVILMMGGHVVRSGAQRYIIDLLERGLLTCLSMNGSCAIHDYELALIGATTESVARYIKEGQFGLWSETGGLNDIVNRAVAKDRALGMGGSLGRALEEGHYPHKNISLLAACHRLGLPALVHVSIGQDITHEMPNFDPAATALASYNDFLTLASLMEAGLEGGVIMNFGSAVTAPEVYLKALSMARNAALQAGRNITRITSLVCDLRDLPSDVSAEPPKSNEQYYFRPWKTMLVRTVAEGGEGLYLKAPHAESIPALWAALTP